jgi:ABC-type Mn2+/Zn2+ transport system permease subunit
MGMMGMDSIVLGAGMAAAAGLVGCFALMRRMTLAADALSHVALPGIGAAIAAGLEPLWGATAALLLGAALIWALEERTRIATETVTGVVFTASLAVGSLLATHEELIDALFGTAHALSRGEFLVGLAAEAAIIAFILWMRKRLVLALVSPDIARTAGLDVGRLNLLYLWVFALTVALGLRYLGVLLMGALIIIPAATARRLARGLTAMLAIAAAAAMLSTLAGTSLAAALGKPSGPFIVLFASGLFCLGLIGRAGGRINASGRE